MNRPLFSGSPIPATSENLLRQVREEIESSDNDYVLGVSGSELEDFWLSKASISPLTIHADRRFIEEKRGIQMVHPNHSGMVVRAGDMVRGTQLLLAIPYEGDKWLWHARPSNYAPVNHPDLVIYDDRIVLQIQFADETTAEELQAKVDKATELLTVGAAQQLKTIRQHNAQVQELVPKWLAKKRETARVVTGAVNFLNIPLKPRAEADPNVLPIKRQALPIQPIAVSKKFAPEYALAAEQYEHILVVLRRLSLVIERNHASFQDLQEQAIRDHFLIQLNGHYEGTATGETFNGVGKTDILISHEGRTVFIAECKVWRGPADAEDAITQLFSYLTWRDCKCALVVFNRNRDTTAVAQSLDQKMTERTEFRRTLQPMNEGEGRYVFVKESDPGREIIVTAMVFDMPLKG